jgi:small subunit ribosomal protein S14
MAKKSSIEKNNRRAKLAKQVMPRRQRLKAIARDRDAAPEDRFEAQLKLSDLPRNSSATRVRNRCSLTGRPRGFYRKFRLSRIAVRELASSGQIPGMLKSSW